LKSFLFQHPLASHLLVVLQMCGIALCCFPVGLQNLGSIFWLIPCALGISVGLATLCYNKIGNFSVDPEIKPQALLITNGPYHLIRHPMYTSLMVMMVSIALYNFHWLNAVGVVMVIFAVINKANKEEKLLLIRFANYAEYQQKSARFLPYLY